MNSKRSEMWTCLSCKQAVPKESVRPHVKSCLRSLFEVRANDGQYEGIVQQAQDHSSVLKTKVECPLCGTPQDRKAVGVHMNEKCLKRVVECDFCKTDVEAWEKKEHEASCRQRPGTCEHCQKQFATVAELEDIHHPKCPEMPVKCTFHQLGCPFSAPRREVPSHELKTLHAGLLVAHISQLKAENLSLRRTIEQQKATYKATVEKMLNGVAETPKSGTDLEARLANLEETMKGYCSLLQKLFLS